MNMVNQIETIQDQMLLTENEQAFINQKKKEQELKNKIMEIAKKTDFNRFFQLGMYDIYLQLSG